MQRVTGAVAATLLLCLPLAAGPATTAAAEDMQGAAGLSITIPLGEEEAMQPVLDMRGSAEAGWEAGSRPLEAPAALGDPELKEADRLPRIVDPATDVAAASGAAAAPTEAGAPRIVRRAVGDSPLSSGLLYLPPGIVPGPPDAEPLPSSVLP